MSCSQCNSVTLRFIFTSLLKGIPKCFKPTYCNIAAHNTVRRTFRHPLAIMYFTRWWAFSSPEAVLLLVSTKNRDLLPGLTPEGRDSRTSRHAAHAHSQIWQIWLVLVSIYCVYKAIQKWNVVGPGLGADLKERGLWGREWMMGASTGNKSACATLLQYIALKCWVRLTGP